ncbi:hypothetical protein H0484_03115 [Pusillimonas sp. CC-YST705]|uniref:Cytochrome C oxidase subunit I n=1 Tax=Mesopusillimonas faecipullorum TaxID=2755040 RepID=A0ABS8C9N7_9BURK|nr:hypothetical protein [Mesopusillimonas faecipullorum]MCB5362745.1 hypothetical protein [Mesopusillimonas faecipullorum]
MASPSHSAAPARKRSLLPVVGVLVVCLAPLLLAFLAYFLPDTFFRPEGSSNYGTLIEPQRPVPAAEALGLATLDGEPFDLKSLAGKWVLATADVAECPESCATKLFILRNSHATQGKNVDRLRRVWFVLDDGPVPEKVLEAYQGAVMVRVDPSKLAAFVAPDASPADLQQALREPMWIIDPLGNLMMSYSTDSDPMRVRKDISKLLFNSRIG